MSMGWRSVTILLLCCLGLTYGGDTCNEHGVYRHISCQEVDFSTMGRYRLLEWDMTKPAKVHSEFKKLTHAGIHHHEDQKHYMDAMWFSWFANLRSREMDTDFHFLGKEVRTSLTIHPFDLKAKNIKSGNARMYWVKRGEAPSLDEFYDDVLACETAKLNIKQYIFIDVGCSHLKDGGHKDNVRMFIGWDGNNKDLGMNLMWVHVLYGIGGKYYGEHWVELDGQKKHFNADENNAMHIMLKGPGGHFHHTARKGGCRRISEKYKSNEL